MLEISAWVPDGQDDSREPVGKEYLEQGADMGYYAEKTLNLLHKEVHVLAYKVVEIGNVTEDVLEESLNEWVAKGWCFDGMQFAMRESSKRPSMAFLIFTRELEE